MVIMNEENKVPGSPKDTTKKTCPRAARENAKKSESTSWKTAHTGLRFHFDRKKLVTHEFNFNSVSKTEKITRSSHRENSVEKRSSAKRTDTTDSSKIKVLMDTLKISKSEGSGSREKSPLRIPKSPVVERLTSKKACTRCTRCSKSPKEEKAEIKPLKVANQPLKTPKKETTHPVKTVKIEIPQSPKTCKKQCSKLTKVLAEPSEKTIKPKSILVHSEKPAVLDDEKNGVSKNCEPVPSPKSTPTKKQCSKLAKLLAAEPQDKNLNAKSNTVHAEKSPSSLKSNGTTEKKIEFAWPSSGKIENMSTILETSNPGAHEGGSGIPNGTEHPDEPDTKACLLNGTRHDEHLCDPHLGLESPGGTRREVVSKIPRKTPGASGLKSEGSLSKDMVPQPLIEL